MYSDIDIIERFMYNKGMYRILSEKINKNFESSKSRIVLIIGLRQTGKSTLAKNICQGRKYQLFNFDLISDQQ